ncbi:MAG TPA: 8-amino-7-oxononanoate synthase [Gemmataceae bacterium]|nr:8-amino-7-oxononanoate synthase [Gemmataceae bacterium]
MNLIRRWLKELEALRAQGRFRTLQSGHGTDFASNDYLGYAKLQLSIPTNLSTSGAASRLLRGHHSIWDTVESELARWHGAEAALVMTSGYVANQGLLSTVIEQGDWVASDAFNHASIIDGLRLSRGERHIYQHGDFKDLERSLRAAPKEAGLFIVTESLFSMEGDVSRLTELIILADRYGAHVIVDEAHSTGCFGPEGSGIVDAHGVRSRVLATVHTGGKALGVPGAYICCSEVLKQLLINRCRHFVYTTALPPLVGAWWLEALQRVRADNASRKRLNDNARLFREELAGHGVNALGAHYIIPVVLGDDSKTVQAAALLQEAGFDIRAIRPPTVPESTARLRISIHADHDADTLRRAAAAVAEAVR